MTSSAHKLSPRAASAVLTNALGYLDLVQPPGAREPIRQILRAAIEACVLSHSLLGTPVVNAIGIAQALVEAGRERDDGGGS